MAAVPPSGTVLPPAFAGAAERARLRVVPVEAPPAPPPPVVVEAPAPPPPPPPAPPIVLPLLEERVPDFSKLAAAVEKLQLISDRLAAEARADALEVALMVARKIVEGELATNVDRMINLVRTAVRRLGESRRIVIRLAPADAEAFAAASTKASNEALGAGTARVEIIADSTLERGDCLVDGDLVSVDGRLDTRFAELRRALSEGEHEEGPA